MWIFTCNWVLLVACFTSVLDYFFPLCYTQPGVLHVSPPVGLLFWSSFKGLYISVCWGIHLDILIFVSSESSSLFTLSLCHCVSVSLGPFRCSRCVCETCGTGQRRRSERKHPDPRPTDRCKNLLPDPGRSCGSLVSVRPLLISLPVFLYSWMVSVFTVWPIRRFWRWWRGRVRLSSSL